MVSKNSDRSRWGMQFDTENEADFYIEGMHVLNPLKQVSTRTRTVKQNGEKRDIKVPVFYGVFTSKFFDSKYGKWYVSCQNNILDQIDIQERKEQEDNFQARQQEKYLAWLKTLTDNRKN